MVQINLSPTLVKKNKTSFKINFNIGLAPIIFAIVAAIVMVIAAWVILQTQFSARQKELDQLNQRVQSLRSTLRRVEGLNKEKQKLQELLGFMRQHLKRDILWARDLSVLSDLIPVEIWLKKLELQNKKTDDFVKHEKLNIEASAVSIEGEEMMNIIGEFMSSLERDPLFSKQFSRIQLISSKRSKADKIEIMDFELICQFK